MIVCEVCGKDMKVGLKNQGKITCSDSCRKQKSRIGSEQYSGKNIKIKKEAVFSWEGAISLSEEFGKDVDWIKRGLDSCDAVNVSRSYFIDKYLKHLDIEFREDVDAASKIIQFGKCE